MGAGAKLCSAGIGLVGPMVAVHLAFALAGCRCRPAGAGVWCCDGCHGLKVRRASGPLRKGAVDW